MRTARRLAAGLFAIWTAWFVANDDRSRQVTPRTDSEREEEHEAVDQDRQDWLNQRLGIIDADAHALSVVREWKALASTKRVHALAALDGAAWEQLGPAPLNETGTTASIGPYSGRLTSISVHPRDAQVILAASDGGGIWRTDNNGRSWRAMAERECSSFVTAVTFDPANPNIAYAGGRCGLMRSFDTGVTWTRTADLLPRPATGETQLVNIQALALDLDTAGTTRGTILLIAASGGMYRSTDSGATVSRVASMPNGLLAVRQSPSQRNRFYALTQGAAFRSDDKGTTWRQLPVQISLALRLSVSTQEGETVYVTHRATSESAYQVAITKDGGDSWTSIAAPDSEKGTGGRASIVPLAGASPMLFHGVSYWLWRNEAWVTAAANGIHADGHWATHISDTELLLATDGGPYKGTIQTNGISWQSLAGDLSTFQIYPGVSVESGDPDSILFGTQDNGTLLRRNRRWQRIQGADGGWTAFERDNSNVLYGEEQRPLGAFSCTRSASITSCQAPSPSGLDFTQTAFIPPMVRSESASRTLYYATSQVYRSSDGGQNWTAISDHFPFRVPSNCSTNQSDRATITTLAVRGGAAETIVAGTNAGTIWRSVDGGATWSLSGAPACYAVNDIYIDAVTGTMFAAYARPSTFAGTTRDFGVVLRSTDNGATWQNISGDFPVLAAVSVAYEPSRRMLFVGNEIGVYVGGPDGREVGPVQTGMSVVTVQDLVFDSSRNYLYAATWGRGMYRLTLAGR